MSGAFRVPTPMEIEVLMLIKRMVRSLFSVSDVELLWNPAMNTYVVGVSYDYNIAQRLPTSWMGVAVKQYVAWPKAYMPGRGTPGATISYGPTRLSTDQGWGIGWPETMFSGGGIGMNNYNYCYPPPPEAGSNAQYAGMFPPKNGSYCGRGC